MKHDGFYLCGVVPSLKRVGRLWSYQPVFPACQICLFHYLFHLCYVFHSRRPKNLPTLLIEPILYSNVTKEPSSTGKFDLVTLLVCYDKGQHTIHDTPANLNPQTKRPSPKNIQVFTVEAFLTPKHHPMKSKPSIHVPCMF
jgi:hypothetical protein